MLYWTLINKFNEAPFYIAWRHQLSQLSTWELMRVDVDMFSDVFSVFSIVFFFFFFSDFSLGCPLRFNLHKCCGTLAQDGFEGEQNSSYEFLSARDEGHPLALTHC